MAAELEHRQVGELDPAGSPLGQLLAHALKLVAAGATSGQLLLHGEPAWAYVYAGSWVADCARGCGGTEFVTELPAHLRGVAGNWGLRKTVFHCACCGFVTTQLQWPADADAIQQVLDRRPVPHTRNWYPAGHPVAVRARIPDGQTVADLRSENTQHGVS